MEHDGESGYDRPVCSPDPDEERLHHDLQAGRPEWWQWDRSGLTKRSVKRYICGLTKLSAKGI